MDGWMDGWLDGWMDTNIIHIYDILTCIQHTYTYKTYIQIDEITFALIEKACAPKI